MTSIDDLLNIESNDVGDIKAWINKVITEDTSDSELKDLIMKLQFVSSDIGKNMDRLQDQLSQSIPSLKQILNDISTESISLKQDFDTITRDVSIIHERNQSVIGNLSQVSSVQNRMNLCVDSLSEIHHWEIRVKKVNKLFEQREFEQVGKELQTMRSRVQMLENNMPQLYTQRHAMLQQFVDKLENMVMPFLNETFEKHDYRMFRHYSQILLQIEKRDEIEKQYIINRLDTIKQLLQHATHHNTRLNQLDHWFLEFLLNLLQFFIDEYEWSLQIFNNKQQSISIAMRLINNICDEINIELREWISVFLASSSSAPPQSKPVIMYRLLCLFEIFSQFFVSVYNSRLLSTVSDMHTHSKKKKNDTLNVMANINKLISSLLRRYYKSNYYDLERYLLFAIFDASPISIGADAVDAESESSHAISLSSIIPTPIRWIQENQLNELSFVEINERIDDSMQIFVDTLQHSHKRCIVLSHAALIKDIMGLYDSFIVEYMGQIDKLLHRCRYDSSKMMSPFHEQQPENKQTDNESEKSSAHLSSSSLSKTTDFNWIVDLKRAFTLKLKIDSMEQRITECVDKVLLHFNASIHVLCDTQQQQQRQQQTVDEDDNASILFYRIFLSDSQLQLLSKFSSVGECKKLLAKSVNQETSTENVTHIITQKIDNRMESILLNIMMEEIRRCIQNVHALAIWTEKPKKSETMLNLPQFKPQPNEYIKKIGTHLFALAQQLESHTNDEQQAHREDEADRMKLMNMMLDDEEEDADGDQEEEKTEDTTEKEKKKEKEREEEETDTRDDSIDSEKWLNLVLDETVQALFMEFYKLNGLSFKGTKQLIEDLNYLSGIANAIYLDEPEFIYAIILILQCKLGNANALRDALLDTKGVGDNQEEEDDDYDRKTQPKLKTSFQRKVATKFAILRGLNVRFV